MTRPCAVTSLRHVTVRNRPLLCALFTPNATGCVCGGLSFLKVGLSPPTVNLKLADIRSSSTVRKRQKQVRYFTNKNYHYFNFDVTHARGRMSITEAFNTNQRACTPVLRPFSYTIYGTVVAMQCSSFRVFRLYSLTKDRHDHVVANLLMLCVTSDKST